MCPFMPFWLCACVYIWALLFQMKTKNTCCRIGRESAFNLACLPNHRSLVVPFKAHRQTLCIESTQYDTMGLWKKQIAACVFVREWCGGCK